MAITLKKEVIVDRWTLLVKDAGGKAGQVYKDTEGLIQKADPPQVSFRRVDVAPSLVGGFLGKARTFILVTNMDLPGYNMYIAVRDYGKNLDLAWYLTYQPSFFERYLNFFLGWFFKKTLVPTLNLFQDEDLRAYTTVVHHAFLEAVDVLTKGTDIQFERKSAGFLGIS